MLLDGRGSFEWSFDFSKFPNLQEVNFGCRVGQREGGVPWIHLALSTLRPATSPRLSAIRLKFTNESSIVSQSAETLIEDMGNDPQRIAGEVARIEREFKKMVTLTVLRDPVLGWCWIRSM